MGVHGLWRILEPTADPVKLDALRGKVLAIDASIWIYHFLKAMRDPKGTVLTAAHIIGFFRRICKLMFFEIRPVFVFDGAAPVWKKKTTNKRNERRIGREQNARATANKLLTLQLQKAAASQSEQQDGQMERQRPPGSVEVVGSVPEDARYMDELNPADANNAAPEGGEKPFVKLDQYHLPSINSIGPIRSDDQRLLTQDELDEYAQHFTSQARSGFIDTSLVDFHSREFEQLPPETQYQLLNMARMKSRLRMGYTAEELNKMFPNEMEFSKFQINRVAQRNFFTQKLMNIVGLEDDLTRRVSSEKNKEYYLKRTDQGWSLSLEERQMDSKTAKKVVEGMHPSQQADLKHEETDDSDFEEVDLSAASPDESQKKQSQEPGHAEVELQLEREQIPEQIDLTTEESAKIDELFGFEAGLSRQGLYDKLMNEIIDEEVEGEAPGRREGTGERSLLFGNSRAADEEERAPNSESKPAVPWFTGTDEGFKEMAVREQNDVPNRVFVDRDYLSESDGEAEAFEGFDESHRPATEISSGVDSNAVTKEVASSQLFSDTDSRTHGSEQAVQEVEEPLGNYPEQDTEQAQGQAQGQEPSTRLALENFADVNRSQGMVSGAAANESGSPIPQVHHDLSRDEGREAEDAEVGSPVSDEQDVPKLAEPKATTPLPENLEEEKVELSKDAAERAEKEAQEEREEDEDIAGMLIAEAEENERFARELAHQSKAGWTDEDQREYETQINDLRKQFGTQSRDADNVSNEMVQECQELLQLFGIPYITAPAEAEAQCAELRQLRLVDGVVTDDGDTFLFDSNAVVYRNMFSQAKFVEFYTMKQIESKLGLSRDGLIDLAFLLGSDYTEGVLGIGPVTGVEILAEFGSLRQFAEWWREAQRFPDNVEIDTALKRRLFKQFRSKLFLPEDFPSPQIREAYLHPAVNKDSTKFDWGNPDLDGLRKFMATVAGWTVDKTNAALLPVVQETKRKELLRKTEKAYDQMKLDDYYQTVVQNPNLGSKRAAKAANTMRKKRARSDSP